MSAKRSTPLMARITKVNTRPELVVRQLLSKAGFRYRLYDSTLPGTPDIVLPLYRTVVRINGCFWHGHGRCRLFRPPTRNKTYWIPKIQRNRVRDKQNSRKLHRLGWRVLTVWECELGSNRLDKTICKLRSAILDNPTQ